MPVFNSSICIIIKMLAKENTHCINVILNITPNIIAAHNAIPSNVKLVSFLKQ